MIVANRLAPERIVFLDGSEKSVVLEDLCRVIAGSPEVTDPVALRQAIFQREAVLSTGIGLGLAVPHAKIDSVREIVMALGVHRAGVEYGSIDGQPVHFLAMVATPVERQGEYLRLLAGIVEIFKDESNRRSILEATDPSAILERLRI